MCLSSAEVVSCTTEKDKEQVLQRHNFYRKVYRRLLGGLVGWCSKVIMSASESEIWQTKQVAFPQQKDI